MYTTSFTIHLALLSWIALMSIVYTYEKNIIKKKILIGGQEEARVKYSFAVLVFLPIVLWVGFRPGKGFADTNAYIALYRQFPSSIVNFVDYIKNVDGDYGFHIFGTIIKLIFGDNYRIFFLSIALVQGFILIWFFRTYSSNYMLSFFLVMTTTVYFSWMCNGIRQFLAVVIVLTATPCMLKKKHLSTLLIVLFASTIHFTAIIMVPIAYIVQGEPWNKKTLFFILLAFLVIGFTEQFTSFLDSFLIETQYEGIVSNFEKDDGSNPIRLIVYSVPAIISFIGRKKIKTMKNPIINICVNMSIISMGLYLVSTVTSGVLMGRLPIYVSLYSFILLPYEVDVIFDKQSSRIIKLTMILSYLIYFIYSFYSWGRI